MKQAYSDRGFWAKVGDFAAAAGREVLQKALTLYYTMQDPNTPPWAKAAILAALAYFISPVDAVPDFIPGVGYSDDLAVLASAMITVAAHVSDEAVEQADATVDSVFGRQTSFA